MKQTTVMSVVLVVSGSFAALGFTQEPQAHRERLSSRQFLEGVDAGCVFLPFRAWVVGSDEDLPAPRFLLEWGRRGKGEGEFDACVGIAIGKNDEVYTSEFRNQRVQRFTSEGRFLGAFAVRPHAGGLAVVAEGED